MDPTLIELTQAAFDAHPIASSLVASPFIIGFSLGLLLIIGMSYDRKSSGYTVNGNFAYGILYFLGFMMMVGSVLLFLLINFKSIDLKVDTAKAFSSVMYGSVITDAEESSHSAFDRLQMSSLRQSFKNDVLSQVPPDTRVYNKNIIGGLQSLYVSCLKSKQSTFTDQLNHEIDYLHIQVKIREDLNLCVTESAQQFVGQKLILKAISSTPVVQPSSP